MTDRQIRPAQELKMHAAILRIVGERGLGRRPIAEVTTADVAAMAHAAWRTLPEARPSERLANGSLPVDLRQRAAVQAPSREAAERVPVRPLAALSPAPVPTEPSGLPSPRERALQRLRADATACAVLTGVAESRTDQAIAERLGLTRDQVKTLVRRWLRATESQRRWNLAAWAGRNGATGAEAGR